MLSLLPWNLASFWHLSIIAKWHVGDARSKFCLVVSSLKMMYLRGILQLIAKGDIRTPNSIHFRGEWNTKSFFIIRSPCCTRTFDCWGDLDVLFNIFLYHIFFGISVANNSYEFRRVQWGSFSSQMSRTQQLIPSKGEQSFCRGQVAGCPRTYSSKFVSFSYLFLIVGACWNYYILYIFY